MNILTEREIKLIKDVYKKAYIKGHNDELNHKFSDPTDVANDEVNNAISSGEYGEVSEITREDLMALCERGFVHQSKWQNRDSANAIMQLGEVYAMLCAGCDFELLHTESAATDYNMYWVEISFMGFGNFEGSGELDTMTAYIPTKEKLDYAELHDIDWY